MAFLKVILLFRAKYLRTFTSSVVQHEFFLEWGTICSFTGHNNHASTFQTVFLDKFSVCFILEEKPRSPSNNRLAILRMRGVNQGLMRR